MDRFVTRGVLFILSFLVLNILLYFTVSQPIFSSSYIYRQQEMSQYGKVLISDSHGAFLGSSPERIGVYNFSFHSESMADFYYKAQFAVEQLKKGDTIVLAVDPHVLSSYRSLEMQESTVGYCTSFEKTLGEYSRLGFLYKRLGRYLPLIDPSLNELLYIGMRTRWLGEKKHRNKWSDLKLEDRRVQVTNRYQEQFGDSQQSTDMTHIFRKIATLCKSRSIVLIGIRFPISHEYAQAIGERDFGMDTLCADLKIPYWDFTNVLQGYGEYFADQDHLNEDGVQCFLDIWKENSDIKDANRSYFNEYSVKDGA